MKKTIKIKRNAKVYFELGDQMLEEGRLEQAAYYFYQSLVKRESVEALVALGETYCEMGRQDEGLKYLLQALHEEPDSMEICESIAEVYADMGDEDAAFFYLTPGMTIKRFNYIMREGERIELMENPRFRVIEKSDEMIMAIAIKLLESGDADYAGQMLLSIKPKSPQYITAANILALNALENDKPDEALKHVSAALAKKDTVFTRCNQLLVYDKLGEIQKKLEVIGIIESKRLSEEEHKSAALAYLRLNEPEYAAKHLATVLDKDPYGRDALVSYALCLYNTGKTAEAKREILKAHYAYPADIAICEILRRVNCGEPSGLYPFLDEKTAEGWIGEIEKKLDILKEEANTDFYLDAGFKQKITWLYQTKFSSRQNKTSLVLAKYPRWRKFLQRQLLSGSWELSAKKVCLYALLFNGQNGRIGIVLEGMYARLRAQYPEGMDKIFRTAYCLAFSSFAFCDSSFEDRLFGVGTRLLKKYNGKSFDKSKIKSEEALAAAIFYAAKHKEIVSLTQCCHIFGCSESEVKLYLSLFGIKVDSIK